MNIESSGGRGLQWGLSAKTASAGSAIIGGESIDLRELGFPMWPRRPTDPPHPTDGAHDRPGSAPAIVRPTWVMTQRELVVESLLRRPGRPESASGGRRA